MKKYRYRLENLDCAKCASEIEEALSKDSRLEKVVVNFSTLQLSFESNEEIVLPIVKKIVLATEPDVKVLDMNEDVLENKNKFYGNLIRLGIGIFLTLIGYFLELPWHFNTFTYLIAYVILLYRTFIVAMKLLVKSKTINESFLISISTIGAFLIGEELEGLMVIILYEIGKILEDRAIHSTRKSIKGLMDIKAEYANKKDGEKIVRKIFHFEDDNNGTSIAAGMAMSAMALSKSKSIGKSLKSGVTSAKNLGRNAKNMIGHIGTDALVLGSMISGKNKVTDSEGNTHRMSYAETKEQIKEKRKMVRCSCS